MCATLTRKLKMTNVAGLISNKATLDLGSATVSTSATLSDLKDWAISVKVAYVTMIPSVNDYSTVGWLYREV